MRVLAPDTVAIRRCGKHVGIKDGLIMMTIGYKITTLFLRIYDSRTIVCATQYID